MFTLIPWKLVCNKKTKLKRVKQVVHMVVVHTSEYRNPKLHKLVFFEELQPNLGLGLCSRAAVAIK